MYLLQYVSTLEAQLSEAAQKNNALIKENEALRTKVKLLEKEVSTSGSFYTCGILLNTSCYY